MSASQRLASTLQSLPAVHRPAERLIATELRYNKLRPFRTAWKMMIVGAALAAAAMRIRRRWFDVVAVIADDENKPVIRHQKSAFSLK